MTKKVTVKEILQRLNPKKADGLAESEAVATIGLAVATVVLDAIPASSSILTSISKIVATPKVAAGCVASSTSFTTAVKCVAAATGFSPAVSTIVTGVAVGVTVAAAAYATVTTVCNLFKATAKIAKTIWGFFF